MATPYRKNKCPWKQFDFFCIRCGVYNLKPKTEIGYFIYLLFLLQILWQYDLKQKWENKWNLIV